MLQDKTIGFIGAGNMAEALVGGLLNAGLSTPERLLCADVQAGRRRTLEERYGVGTAENNLAVIEKSDIIIYAVKPQNLNGVLKETIDHLTTDQVIISIAAGEYARDEDLEMAEAIFNAVGRCIQVAGEHLLDAVTGLSASGPAYIFLMMEALADGGVKKGLGRREALLLAAQTILGAARMHLETGTHPGQLKDMVTSPGGTTIAGLHALEKGGVRAALINAVEAAADRATELGRIK